MAASGVDVAVATGASDPQLGEVSPDSGHVLSFGLSGAVASPGAVKGDTTTFVEVLPQVDLQLQAVRSGLLEKLILKRPSAQSTFVYPLKMTGLNASIDQSGQVVFTDVASGKPVLRIPKGWMEDSNVGANSGEGTISQAVTYTLVPSASGQALQMTLNPSWLQDPARVFPVTVDPTTVTYNDDQDDTYVMTNLAGNHSTETEMKVGTYDGGTHLAAAYLHFTGVNALANDNILSAQLAAYNDWSWSCQARGVGLYRVTAPWSGWTMTTYPGAAYADEVGWSPFAHGYTPGGCAANYGYFIGSTSTMTTLVQNWAHGNWPNYGLTMRVDPSSQTDNYAWKMFSAYEGYHGGPIAGEQLNVTYTPYGAVINPANQFTTSVTPTANGVLPVLVTNQGHDTWPAGGTIRLSYHLYDSTGTTLLNYNGARTFLPVNVPPGGQLLLNANVNALANGSYRLRWDMVDDGTTWFSTEGVAQVDSSVTVYNAGPTITAASPLGNSVLGTA